MRENDYQALACVLRDWVASHVPDWTEANGSDPGIAILELLAFVAESLEARGDALPDRGRLIAARLARSALTLAGGKDHASGGELARNHYYVGRLLSAQDFQLEQDYFRRRLRRLNRELHGAGVVRGLQVSVHPKDGGTGEQIVVHPGFAIDLNGEEIEVGFEASISLPETESHLSVMLSHCDHLAHPALTSDEENVQFTRTEETFALHLETTPAENGIALAHLSRTTGGWKVDQSFLAPRARSSSK